jgi:hypothetical protein
MGANKTDEKQAKREKSQKELKWNTFVCVWVQNTFI